MSIELRKFIYLICCFITSFLLCNSFIKIILSRKTRGQVERDFALRSHLVKDGTPTMGGIAIVFSSVISSFLYGINIINDNNFITTLFIFVMYFVIGFVDDYLKIKLKSYEGLKGIYRIIYEIVITLVSFIFINLYISKYSYIEIKLFDLVIPLGLFYILFIILIVVGMSNSVNLTDGLDGLAAGLMLTSLLPFLCVCLQKNEFNISLLIISLIGSLIAFLIYNIYPAKIFMGDCGSLSLGALIAFISIILKEYLILIIGCSFFMFESLSVIIQVLYYKKTKRRIFLMAPFHHHLEKKGKNETQIVMSLWVYGFFCALLCLIIEVI